MQCLWKFKCTKLSHTLWMPTAKQICSYTVNGWHLFMPKPLNLAGGFGDPVNLDDKL